MKVSLGTDTMKVLLWRERQKQAGNKNISNLRKSHRVHVAGDEKLGVRVGIIDTPVETAAEVRLAVRALLPHRISSLVDGIELDSSAAVEAELSVARGLQLPDLDVKGCLAGWGSKDGVRTMAAVGVTSRAALLAEISEGLREGDDVALSRQLAFLPVFGIEPAEMSRPAWQAHTNHSVSLLKVKREEAEAEAARASSTSTQRDMHDVGGEKISSVRSACANISPTHKIILISAAF
jgi:hypothetical protein